MDVNKSNSEDFTNRDNIYIKESVQIEQEFQLFMNLDQKIALIQQVFSRDSKNMMIKPGMTPHERYKGFEAARSKALTALAKLQDVFYDPKNPNTNILMRIDEGIINIMQGAKGTMGENGRPKLLSISPQSYQCVAKQPVAFNSPLSRTPESYYQDTIGAKIVETANRTAKQKVE